MISKLAFVDLETTGTTAQNDRITEVGIVLVDTDGIREWNSLVNPGRPIPPMIQSLTGISNDMVADAPRFGDLAADIARQLRGYLFIAHNARFDHGFLHSEFARIGMDFRPTVLCTVRLSRKLYPQHRRHNLDSIIERHSLPVGARHRALDDARLLWHFWQSIHRDFPAEHILATLDTLTGRVEWPDYLDPELPDRLPDTHGVYLFYNESNLPLYVGKADRLRERVLSHFQPARRASAKAQRLVAQTRRIEWVETGGPLGTLLQESCLVRQLAPSHNRRPRRIDAVAAAWPYRGPIGIKEGPIMHIVQDWGYVGSARSDAEVHDLLEHAKAGFDDEIHRILRDRLSLVRVLELFP